MTEMLYSRQQNASAVRKHPEARQNLVGGSAMSSIPKSPGVYIITNTVDGKVYIGSSLDMRKRCEDHVSQLRRGVHHNRRLQNAWNKHSGDVFVFDVLEVVKTRDRSATIPAEQKWLDFFQVGREACYNFLLLASSPGSQVTKDETRRRISESKRGKRLTPEHKAKLRRARIGRPLSEAHRAALSAARVGKKMPPRTGEKAWPYRKMSVEQVQKIRDLAGMGWGVKSIAAELGIGATTAQRVLTGMSYLGVGEVRLADPADVAARLRTRQKLAPEQVIELRDRYADGEAIASLARAFGLSHTAASKVAKGASYRWV